MSMVDVRTLTGITGDSRGAKSVILKPAPKHSEELPRLWLNSGEVSAMDDVKLALLGDKEAARRLTEAGVLLPCPFCGADANIVAYDPRLFRPSMNHVYSVFCNECEMMFGWDVDYGGRYDTEYEARLAWNTRAPILNAEEIEMLDGKEAQP